MTDLELIQQGASGNQDAMAVLFSKYRSFVFRVVFKVSGSSNYDIDDIVQDTFIKTFASLHTFKGPYKFPTWLHKIAVNATIDHFRKKNKYITYHIVDDLGEEKVLGDCWDKDCLLDDSNNPEEKVISEETIRIIISLIKNLPKAYRTTLRMRLFEDMPYREIASVLHIALGTVKSNLFRGKAMIKEQLLEV